jgi:uncharacterized protein with NRDE domain
VGTEADVLMEASGEDETDQTATPAVRTSSTDNGVQELHRLIGTFPGYVPSEEYGRRSSSILAVLQDSEVPRSAARTAQRTRSGDRDPRCRSRDLSTG